MPALHCDGAIEHVMMVADFDMNVDWNSPVRWEHQFDHCHSIRGIEGSDQRWYGCLQTWSEETLIRCSSCRSRRPWSVEGECAKYNTNRKRNYGLAPSRWIAAPQNAVKKKWASRPPTRWCRWRCQETFKSKIHVEKSEVRVLNVAENKVKTSIMGRKRGTHPQRTLLNFVVVFTLNDTESPMLSFTWTVMLSALTAGMTGLDSPSIFVWSENRNWVDETKRCGKMGLLQNRKMPESSPMGA